MRNCGWEAAVCWGQHAMVFGGSFGQLESTIWTLLSTSLRFLSSVHVESVPCGTGKRMALGPDYTLDLQFFPWLSLVVCGFAFSCRFQLIKTGYFLAECHIYPIKLVAIEVCFDGLTIWNQFKVNDEELLFKKYPVQWTICECWLMDLVSMDSRIASESTVTSRPGYGLSAMYVSL